MDGGCQARSPLLECGIKVILGESRSFWEEGNTPIMENQIKKKLENDVETVIIIGNIGVVLGVVLG